jgi:hypothetical protein
MEVKPINAQGLKRANTSEPTLLEQAGQFGKGLASKAVQGALSVPEIPFRALDYLTSNPNRPDIQPISPPRNYPSESVPEKIFGKVKEPENILGKAAYATAANLPLALATGPGGIVQKLGADYAGSLAMQGVEELGLGEEYPLVNAGLQLGAGLLGSHGFNKAAGALKKLPKEPSQIEGFIDKLYKKESELGVKIPVEQQKITENLHKLHEKVQDTGLHKTRFNETAKNRVLKNIEIAANKPYKTAADLAAGKKFVNELYIPEKSKEGRFIAQLKSIYTTPIAELSKKNPKWGNALSLADELYQIQNWQAPFSKIVNDLSSSRNPISKAIANPFTHSVLGFLGHSAITGGISPQAGLAAVGGLAAKGAIKGAEESIRAGKFVNALRKTSEGQKMLGQIAVNSAKRDIPALVSNLNKLSKKAEQFEEDEGKPIPISAKGLRRK